jgi:hypothetical protein
LPPFLIFILLTRLLSLHFHSLFLPNPQRDPAIDLFSSSLQNITAELKEGLFNALSSGADLVSYEAFTDALTASETEAASTQ